MYRYSPIKKIYIKNFRNIGEATIDFDDSPIVSLIGENEAGKTSVVKAFSVCALHATPRDQKDFIRDGTDGFGVAIELQDGTIVTRMKKSALNWYSVKKPDGSEWNTSKIDSGLPLAVSEVMGLIEEPETKEFLQVRTYEDQLLFVVTPASTNYKVMYDALKVDQLTRAIKAGSKEVNALRSEIDTNETGISTLTSNLRKLRTFDISPLLNIKSRLMSEISIIEKLEKANSLLDNIEGMRSQLGALADVISGKAIEINEAMVSKISSTVRILNNLDSLRVSNSIHSQIDLCGEINLDVYSKILGMVDKSSSVVLAKQRLGALIHLDKIESISESEAGHLIGIQHCLGVIQLNKNSSVIYRDIEKTDTITQEEFNSVIKAGNIVGMIGRNEQLSLADKQITDYCKQVSDYIKSLGAAVEICPNCGESVVVDVR